MDEADDRPRMLWSDGKGGYFYATEGDYADIWQEINAMSETGGAKVPERIWLLTDYITRPPEPKGFWYVDEAYGAEYVAKRGAKNLTEYITRAHADEMVAAERERQAASVLLKALEAKADAYDEAAAWCEGDYSDGAVRHFRNLAHKARNHIERGRAHARITGGRE